VIGRILTHLALFATHGSDPQERPIQSLAVAYSTPPRFTHAAITI